MEQLQTKEQPANHLLTAEQEPLLIRLFAHLISYIFHPIFIPLYVTLFLLYLHPSYFTGLDTFNKHWLPLRIAYGTIFLPLVTVLLLKQLKFIDSVLLKTQKDRIIPYIACGIFFFWVYLVCRNDHNIPNIMTGFILGVFLASSAALIANIYYKISMHAIGMGGMVAVFLLIFRDNSMLMTWPLCLAFILTGLVCTSRMIVSDHRPKEIYMGLLVGMACQLAGAVVHG